MDRDFSKLKVGDTVMVINRFRLSLNYIENITNGGNIRVNGTLYDKNTGRSKGGDSWGRSSISVPTPEEIAKIVEADYIKTTLRKLNNLSELSYEQAIGIMKILSESEDNKDV